MTYVKTDWETGDIITAEKLNNIENGVANAGVILTCELALTQDEQGYYTGTLNKTWNQINTAFTNGSYVNIYLKNGSRYDTFPIASLYEESDHYFVDVWDYGAKQTFQLSCNSADGYPNGRM